MCLMAGASVERIMALLHGRQGLKVGHLASKHSEVGRDQINDHAQLQSRGRLMSDLPAAHLLCNVAIFECRANGAVEAQKALMDERCRHCRGVAACTHNRAPLLAVTVSDAVLPVRM